jgi:ABC-2 type transport system ATP-binding protein
MMGLVHQDSGDVEVLGNPMPAAQIATKWETGFASDDMRLYGAMTLEWHLDLMRRIYPTWDEPYAQLLLKRFGLLAEQRIKGISHGQRVKASLLLVLARRPKLLILDEPTTGLDPVARHEILREITSIMTDEDRSVLFSSHNTLDIERICDQITFIDRGRIIDSLDKETYMDRWRRLRLEIPSGASVPALPGVLGIRQTGRIAIVTVNAFQPDLPGAYESGGARVQAVETMPSKRSLSPTWKKAARRWKYETDRLPIDSQRLGAESRRRRRGGDPRDPCDRHHLLRRDSPGRHRHRLFLYSHGRAREHPAKEHQRRTEKPDHGLHHEPSGLRHRIHHRQDDLHRRNLSSVLADSRGRRRHHDPDPPGNP